MKKRSTFVRYPDPDRQFFLATILTWARQCRMRLQDDPFPERTPAFMPLAVDDIALDQYVTVHSERLDAPPIAETMSLPPEVVHLLSTIGSDRTLHGAVMRVVAIALPYVYCKHVVPAKREKPLVVLDVRDVRLMKIDPSMVDFLRAAAPPESSGPEPPAPEPPGQAPAFPDIPF